MPETLPGALLNYKAMAWRSIAKQEFKAKGVEGGGNGDEKGTKWKAEIEDESFGIALQRNLKRPFIMLVKEPILIFFSIYLTGTSLLPSIHPLLAIHIPFPESL